MDDAALIAMANAPLLEAGYPGDLVPWSDYPSNDWPDILPSGRYYTMFTTWTDREDGRLRPIYDNEIDLSRQIAMVRRLIGMNELTAAVNTALKVYTFGAGIELKVQAAAGKPTPPKLVESIQRIVDRFVEDNNLVNNLDVEIHDRSRDDGEAIVPIEREGNKILADCVETIQLTAPKNPQALYEYVEAKCGIDCNSFVPSWLFGVLTSKRRTSRPMGYHIVYNGSCSDWEFYPSDQVVHVKRNVPRTAKRGVSDWLAVKDRITQVAKLATNMGHGAALQAAIPWVEESPSGTTQGQASGIGNPGMPPQMVPNGYNSWRQELQMIYKAGSILRPSPGRKYVSGPSAGQGVVQGFMLVENLLERLIGTRWLMPFQMVSGDYSNNAFASALEATSPFVKAREFDQQFYGGAIKSMLWKVVVLAWKLGWLDTEGLPVTMLEEFVDITVNMTSPATRDRAKLVQQLQGEIAMGATSIRTASTELGRDYDEEVAAGAKPQYASGVSSVEATTNEGKASTADPNSLKPGKADSELDPHKVSQMATAIKSGKSLPPIGVDDEGNVIDGHHRLAAHKQAGSKSVPITVMAKKDAPEPKPGLNAPGARQQDRNQRAITVTLKSFQAGTTSRVVAKGILVGYGVPDATAEAFLDDAAKGKIDSPSPIPTGKKPASKANPTAAAATAAALESVETSAEARAVLESIVELYP